MDYRNFKNCIDKIKKCEKELLAFDKLKIDISETEHVDAVGYFVDMLFMEAFGVDGLDIINWWLYEDVEHVIKYPDGTKYHLKTEKDVYKYITECLKK